MGEPCFTVSRDFRSGLLTRQFTRKQCIILLIEARISTLKYLFVKFIFVLGTLLVVLRCKTEKGETKNLLRIITNFRDTFHPEIK